MNRKWIAGSIFSLLILVLLAAACGGAPTPKPGGTPTVSPQEAAVTAKGAVVPVRFAHISFKTAGTISKLNIKKGAAVKAGDVLAELDTKDLQLQVKAAQDGLDLAQSTLAQAKIPATPQEIQSAQAAYDSAVAALNKLQHGPTPDDMAILKATLEKTKAALDQAQAAFDRAGGGSNPFIQLTPQSLQLQQATLDYQIALANYNKSTKIDPNDVAQAQAAVTQAKATLDLKKQGPRPEDIAVAQVRVQQAQTALQQAQSALTQTQLTAPFDGTITDLTVNQGEIAQPGVAAITLADLSQLQVETTDLDEFGAARVKMGQAVTITVNALNDRALTGKVVNIGQQSVTLATGDISYVVAIALDKQDSDLRWGMTVKTTFNQ